ncbi:hypothetical protein [Sphingomonas sp.]
MTALGLTPYPEWATDPAQHRGSHVVDNSAAAIFEHDVRSASAIAG